MQTVKKTTMLLSLYRDAVDSCHFASSLISFDIIECADITRVRDPAIRKKKKISEEEDRKGCVHHFDECVPPRGLYLSKVFHSERIPKYLKSSGYYMLEVDEQIT